MNYHFIECFICVEKGSVYLATSFCEVLNRFYKSKQSMVTSALSFEMKLQWVTDQKVTILSQ